MTEWTPEQLDNAYKYGICITCRSPREARMVLEDDPHGDVWSYALVCPNGCDQDTWAEFDKTPLLP